MLWLFRGMGSSDAITCGMVIPPETIISAATKAKREKCIR
jgi:hypothetical protein